MFHGDLLGIGFDVAGDGVGIVLLGGYSHLHAGDEVERTGRVMDVAVGDGLLGRVIDPLGRPLDEGGPVATQRTGRWLIQSSGDSRRHNARWPLRP
mgnify:CR=1 FL=1